MSLFVLLIVVCPLMMFFMMRGMGGMRGMHGGHDDDARTFGPNDPSQVAVPADRRDARLAELEREVAELRAFRDRADEPMTTVTKT
jgi:hypothetical protein